MTRKKLLAGITTAIVTAAMAICIALPAQAASVSKIVIEGAKTVTVGNTIELDTEIYPDDDLVRDSDIVWTSSNSSVAKVLVSNGDDTRVKGVKAGTATITVSIKGTSIKATQTVTVKKAQTYAKAAKKAIKKLKKYKAQLKSLKTTIANTKLASTAAQRRSQYYNLEYKLEVIENKIEVIEDTWEHRTGTKAQKVNRKLYKVENYAESVENYLEAHFNYAFD
ncbi:MAG: Ig-like domain-containing protein [Clostridiales bacterium]|nr:Ig-like domain-containing protein [Clostridiales bacterium]